MTHRTLLSLMAATVLGVLPSCGDDDGDTGTSTGGRPASGGGPAAGGPAAGGSGAGARTGGTDGTGGAGARGGTAGQSATGGAAGEPGATGGSGGETASGGAATSGGTTTATGGAPAAGAGGAAAAGEGGSATAGAGGADGDAEAGAGAGGEGGSAGAPTGLEDPEILHVVSTANQGEIEQATIALDRATEGPVRDFAEMMLDEHGASLSEGSELSQSLGLANNPVSMELMATSNAVVVQLKAASSEAFDTLYIESQVMAHETVLSLLDDELIPAADDAALQTYLETTRAAVASHLEAAQEAAAELD